MSNSLLPVFKTLEKIYYLRVDQAGYIIEANDVYIRHANQIGVSSPDMFLTGRNKRLAIAAIERARKTGFGVSVAVNCKWINAEIMPLILNTIQYESTTIVLGYQADMNDKPKILRELAWILSHIIRKPAASLMGLVPFIEKTADNAQVIEFINASLIELDAGIRMAHDLISRTEGKLR